MACDITTCFRARYPEFGDTALYPDPRVQLFLDDAAQDMGSDENRWCGKYDRAQAALAAHYLTKGTLSEAGDTSASVGPITGKTAGGVSVQRAAVSKDRGNADDQLSTTTYGQQFLALRDSCLVGVTVANRAY